MRIGQGHFVTIEYTLWNAAGEVVEDSSKLGTPVQLRWGIDKVLPGLTSVLEGMSVNEEKEGTIPAGTLVPREQCATRRILKKEFPEGVTPSVGDKFMASDGVRPVMFELESEDGADAFVARLLHPLHEQDVKFKVRVTAVRKADVPPPPPMADDVEELADDSIELLDED
jgi:FKBP-type peptidyl-prolyl cis-trans isomerase SlyD